MTTTAEDRSWQYRSGHCLQLGKPNCRGCMVDDCTCPSDWCVAKRSEPARNKGNVRGMVAAVGENGGPSKDAPAGALTPVVPGLTPARRG